MKCFYHEDRDAVGTCQECGKALCKECASMYTPVTCEECHVRIITRARNEREQKKQDALIDTKSEMIKAVAIGSIAGIVLAFLVCKGNAESMGSSIVFWALFFFLMGFGIPFGWAIIGRFIPNFYGRRAGTVMAVVLPAKFLLSVIIGIPAFIVQMVLLAVKYNKIKKS